MRGCGVTLVHSVHPPLPPPPPSILMTDEDWTAVGATIVSGVHQELEGLLDETTAPDEIPVATVVRHGPPGPVLGEMSEDACLVVLQHRSMTRLRRIVSGSTVASVAAHAHCPVVSVPAVPADRQPTGAVCAAVLGDGGPTQVLEAAFAEASARGATLTLLHGWRLESGYDDMVTDRSAWSRRDEAAIAAGAAELVTKYPEVPMRIDVRHEWPAELLAHAGLSADLLVVGRHGGLPGLPHRLGSLARTAVSHSMCPVVVVPV